MSCPITSESNCKCLYDTSDRQMHNDLRSILRKLFTDHGVYTALVIKSIVDGTGGTDLLIKRLMVNQTDIGNELKPEIGDAAGNQLTKLLKEHIKLAGDVIKAAANSDSKLKTKIDALFKNSHDIAAFLTSLNEEKLPFQETKDMFDMHNQFVIDMTTARIGKKFDREIKLYDAYYNELLSMSDAITMAVGATN